MKARSETPPIHAPVHSFSVADAIEHGTDAACILAHFEHFIRKHMVEGSNLHDERTWNYNSVDDLAELMPYLSGDQLRRRLKKLIEADVLVSGNYNKKGYDRTLWYAFRDEVARFGRGYRPVPEEEPAGDSAESIRRNRQVHPAKSPNGTGGIAEPIPDSDTGSDNTSYPSKTPDAEAPEPLAGSGQGLELDLQTPDATVTVVDPDQVEPTDAAAAELPESKGGAAPDWPAEPPTEHEVRSRQAAEFTLAKLIELGVPHARKLSRNPEGTADKWAVEFDRLVRLDEHTWEDVAQVLRWLLRPDNWWIQRGNFQSATKLRQRKEPGGPTLFDRLLPQSKTATSGRPNAEDRRAQNDAAFAAAS